MKPVCVSLSLALFFGLSVARAGISLELARALERADSTGETLPVVLTLRRPLSIAMESQRLSLPGRSAEQRVPALIGMLQNHFRSSFSGILTRLESSPEVSHLHAYWVGAMVAFRGPPSAHPGALGRGRPSISSSTFPWSTPERPPAMLPPHFPNMLKPDSR